MDRKENSSERRIKKARGPGFKNYRRGDPEDHQPPAEKKIKVSQRTGKALPRLFYLRPTLQVAKSLLGKYVVRKLGRKKLVGKIVEVEAYIGPNDPASHAYVGKTERNKVMFEEGGRAYVYFTYGMHFCFNVVTERGGYPAAVLIRAVEPIDGIEEMMKNRGFMTDENDKIRLTNGPAKFCEAFGITREINGIDLTGDELFITNGENIKSSEIAVSERIGIRNGKGKKWRFYVRGNRFVSSFPPSRF